MAFALFETSAGYALFKIKDDGTISSSAKLNSAFSDPSTASKVVNLAAFSRFVDTAEAVKEINCVNEGKVSDSLKAFLQRELVNKKNAAKSLIVSEARLGGSITKDVGVEVLPMSPALVSLYRGLRQQMESLLEGIKSEDLKSMQLGLSHSLSRFKLQFGSDKVDTLIIQAIALLDELDKQLNGYAMRLKEWYGWHFPELFEIVSDSIAYGRIVMAMGTRDNAHKTDLSEIVAPEVEAQVKEAAKLSMGTEIALEDVMNMASLAEQVVELGTYRIHLQQYLAARMFAIAPNLTSLVGELVGARLIAHAGSLISLAKQPGSTVQILGAEKALFRALKAKKSTPKFGILFNASIVGQTGSKKKGPIARTLAHKTALCVRVDALSDGASAGTTANALGLELHDAMAKYAQALEAGTKCPKLSVSQKIRKYEADPLPKTPYAKSNDVVMDDFKVKKSDISEVNGDKVNDTEMKDGSEKKKKKKKDKKVKLENGDADMDMAIKSESEETPKPKKKKKKSKEADTSALMADDTTPVSDSKKKKRKQSQELPSAVSTNGTEHGSEKKKKRKKGSDTPVKSEAEEPIKSSKKKKNKT